MSRIVHSLRLLFRHQQGFSLAIVAALFAAFAVAAVALIDRNVIGQQIDRQQITRTQLTRLSNALIQYAYYNNGRYPCPASPKILLSDATFGQQYTRTTVGCDTPPVVGNPALDVLSNAAPATTEVVRGMVPVHDLVPFGIDNADAFDAWNDRIMYVVNRNQTVPSTAATVHPAVTELPLNVTLQVPDFLLVSYGPDKLGGFQRIQTSLASALVACGSTNDRDENCDGDLTFYVASNFVPSSANAANYFDDVVTMYAPGCIANGISSGGNPLNCCNGDADLDGLCGSGGIWTSTGIGICGDPNVYEIPACSGKPGWSALNNPCPTLGVTCKYAANNCAGGRQVLPVECQ
jgi:hypothetical protein